MMVLKFLYCLLIRKKHDYAMVTGTYLHRKGLNKLAEGYHYEFCLRCHHVNVVKEEKDKNLLEKARKKIR